MQLGTVMNTQGFFEEYFLYKNIKEGMLCAAQLRFMKKLQKDVLHMIKRQERTASVI